MLVEGDETADFDRLSEDPVSAAMVNVPRDFYVLQGDGSQLPQTSSPQIIARMLRMLDVAPGSRVLEVGTGSGYSTALLSRLVGPAGHVVSLDIDAEIVERASALLRSDGRANVDAVVGDGRRGHAAGAPYDRLIAWAAARQVPEDWLQQMTPGGIVVAPIRRAPPVVVKLRLSASRKTVEEDSIAGGYIPLTDKPLRPWEYEAAKSGWLNT